MHSIKYSIIMPAYNAEKYISKSIKSVLGQKFQNYELIIVNDGSMDETEKVILSFNDEKIKYIKQKNGGVSSARNNGLKNAVGDYIMFLDSDDYLSADALSIIDSYTNKYNIDVLKFNYIIKNGIINKKNHFSNQTNKLISSKELKNVYDTFLTSYDLNNVWNSVIKKNLAKSTIFDKDLVNAEDLDYMSNILLEAKNIFFLDKFLYYYYCNNNSISHTMNVNTAFKKMDDLLKCYSGIRKKYTVNDNAFCKRIWNDYTSLLLILVNDSKNFKDYTQNINKTNIIARYQNFLKIVDEKLNIVTGKMIYSKKFYIKLRIECVKKKVKYLVLKIFS